MSENEITKDIEIRPSSWVLWISLLAGLAAFAINFQARYALVQWACFNHREWVLYVIAATAFVTIAAAATMAWIARSRLGDYQRPRFMAMTAFIINCAPLLALIAQVIPQIFLRSCE